MLAPDSLEFFERLVHEHYATVYRFLYRVGGRDRPLAEDLCQEAFARAFRARATLAAVENQRAWLFRVAMNVYLNERRRGRTASLCDVGEPAAPGRSVNPMADRVRDFIQTLPAKQRAATILRVIEEREYDEIALVLSCSLTAARANVSEAMRKIRARFGEEYNSV